MPVPQANIEPLPGYRLLEPLGKGGFGEVWKCEAPGGLVKAIKFVPGNNRQLGDDSDGAAQELRALQHVKSIRHPFLLSMDRVEVVDGDLLIVMELADSSLHDLLEEYRRQGRPGIPRDELLGYLREAAEVLDLMNQEHKLQHLDIKPRNLFLVSRHVKVADFGLVNNLADINGGPPAATQLSSITPVYAAPESFLGKVSQACDQYSLAVAYHEMLTGKVLFNGKNFRQLALQHLQAVPDLGGLPEGDRPAVGRALAKEPQDRFPSCGEFVQALSLGLAGAAERAVPARTFFALDRAAAAPKRATDGDVRPGDTNMGGAPSTVRQPAIPSASAAAAEFAGIRLLECLSRQAGELWRGVTPDGGKRFVRFLCGVDDETLARLAQLKHTGLAKSEVVHDGPNRLALVSEAGDENLAARLKECNQAGTAGVPRPELLDHLADVAAALDDLYENRGVHHLTLSPRTVALVGGKARLLDFGLAALLWLPAGQHPAALNTRYAAPELFEGNVSRHADQYSLALIFHEMTTGIHAFRNLNARQMASARLRGSPDLGLLPAADRVLVLRALNQDPERRFPSCSDFVEALADAATKTTAAPATARIGFAPPTPVTALRTVSPTAIASAQAVNELVALAGEGREVRQRGDFCYLIEPGRSILHHCRARLVPGMVRLKLNSFRDQWKARSVERTGEERFLFHVPLPASLWQRTLGKLPSLAVEVCCTFPTDERAPLTECAVRIWAEGCNQQQAAKLFEDVGPPLLESLRACLNAEPEMRGQVRLPFARPVKVAPVIDGKVGEAIDSMTQDISPRGMSVLMPRGLAAAEVCVLVSLPSRRDPTPIAARVVRVRGNKDGRFEVGLAFG
jgi:serine/threonine protein kinase